MARKKDKIGICGYCGAEGKVTKDHIIPRSLFGDSVPANIPCIWACSACNNRKSADENYVRDFFASDIRTFHHPAAQANFPKVRRSARRNYSSSFVNEVLKSRLVHLYSPGGIYLGYGYKVPTDFKQMDRYTKMLVRGLYYSHCGKRLADNVDFTIRWWENPDTFLEVAHDLLQRGAPHISVGDRSVFECVYQIALDVDPSFSMWFLNFYRRILISVVTKGASSQERSTD